MERRLDKVRLVYQRKAAPVREAPPPWARRANLPLVQGGAGFELDQLLGIIEGMDRRPTGRSISRAELDRANELIVRIGIDLDLGGFEGTAR